MRIATLAFLFFLVIFTNCFAQENLQDTIVDIKKVTFLSPGISYEKKVGKFQSILGQAFMNTSFSIGYSSSLGNTSNISFDPALSFQYRYYYNHDRRQRKGKRTEMNSLNYISPTFETIFSKNRIDKSHYIENKRRPINTIGAVWGFQRNYKNRFSLDFNIGLGYLFTTTTYPDNIGQRIEGNIGKLSALGQLHLGLWLNQMK